MRLLTLDRDGVIDHINKLDRESKAIKSEALSFSWHMRGGLSYDEAMLLSEQERDIIKEIIKKNMETTKESGLPFF
jgi:hypothetical protein